MKKLIVLAAGLSLLLGGCELLGGKGRDHRDGPLRVQVVPLEKPDRNGNPYFVISPHTLVVYPNQREVEIVWSLPRESKLRFAPGKGIVIEGEIKQNVEKLPRDGDNKAMRQNELAESGYIDPQQDQIGGCRAREGGLEWTCQNRHSRPGRYKYSVRLTDGVSDYRIDPFVDNW